MKNALNYTPPETIKQFDILILTETFLRESTDLTGFYGFHTYATPTRGRPTGGVSCFLKATAGTIKETLREENVIIVKTTHIAVIGIYIAPDTAAEDVIDTVLRATACVKKEKNVLLAGDFNCRIDKPNTKSDLLLAMLVEEGFSLANSKDLYTYFAHNGASAIDLVFFRGKHITIKNQKGLWTSGTAPIRKHIPVYTEIQIKTNDTLAKPRKMSRPSRMLDISKIQDDQISRASELLSQGHLEGATRAITDVLCRASIPVKRRQAQKWFDRQCYTARKIALTALYKAKTTRSAEDLETYATRRRQYKRVLKQKRAEHLETAAKTLAENAKSDPFIALKKKTTLKAKEIPMTSWHKHFTEILNKDHAEYAYPKNPGTFTTIFPKITMKEAEKEIQKAKKGKAAGPDNIFIEHIQLSQEHLLPIWTDLFNRCLETGTIPESWRTSRIKILYKGKGDTADPNSYRGIALESTIFKLFSKILTRRLAKEVDEYIPECQFGFRRNRSTLQAVRCLQEEVQNALSHPTGKYHVVFVDYKKAFDLINRQTLVSKLKQTIGDDHPLARIIEDIMAYNFVILDDDVTTSEKVKQTNGVLQGDPLSPLLFSIATADIPRAIESLQDTVTLIMYADDMALGSHSKDELQTALSKLETWANENSFEINRKKTVHMIFRRGGKIASKDVVTLQGEPLDIVKNFKYLGVTLQPTMTSFCLHIQERTTAAIKAMHNIQDISKLSLATAMSLFDTTITPVATYGIEIMWEKLTRNDLARLEKVKARFLKRALGVGKYAPSRLVYELARESFFIEDIRNTMLLPTTGPYQELLEERSKKRNEIDLEFYGTSAMLNRTWTQAYQEQRHIVTRLAIHGCHHKICRTQTFHYPSKDCICSLCNQECDRYHLMKCHKRQKSLRDYCIN